VREIETAVITETVARLFQEANFELGEDVLDALEKALQTEESPQGKEVLSQIIENARIARQEQLPLCQDCGTTSAGAIYTRRSPKGCGRDIHRATCENPSWSNLSPTGQIRKTTHHR